MIGKEDNALASQLAPGSSAPRANALYLRRSSRCTRLGGDPFAYLKDVLERLPTHPVERLGELLTDAWFAAHPNRRRKVTS